MMEPEDTKPVTWAALGAGAAAAAALRATPAGLPYPEITNPVREGAAAIQALAEAIKITHGHVTIPAGSSTVGVTFPADLFDSTPVVLAIGGTSTYVTVAVASATTTGATIAGLYRSAAGAAASDGVPNAQTIRYVAMQIGA